MPDPPSAQETSKRRQSTREGPTIRRHVVSEKNPSDDGDHLPKVIRDAPVLSSDEKPFDTFMPWEEVVRYRSTAGMLLQLAIPTAAMTELRQLYGHQLEEARLKTGARIEIGNSTPSGDWDLTAVTLSGAATEIRRARDYLLSKRPPKWLLKEPRTETELPSKSLRLGARIVRRSDGDRLRVEIVYSVFEWALIQLKVNFEAWKAQGVDIECPPEHEGPHFTSTSTIRRQPVILTGTRSGIDSAMRLFHSARVAALMSSEQDKSKASLVPEPTSTRDANVPGDPGTHRLVLEIPLDPDGGDRVRQTLHGTAGYLRLNNIRHTDGIKTRWKNSGTLRLVGREMNVQAARVSIQDAVSAACAELNMAPILLREVDSGPVDVSKESPGDLVKDSSKASPAKLQRAPSKAQHQKPNPGAELANSAPVADNTDSEGTSPLRAMLADDMKLALRALTHPVVLVTSSMPTNSADASSSIDELLAFCRGVTVSSFTTVTLEPKPIVSFNIRTPSRSWDAISTTGWFTAHLLRASPAGAALAHAFTLPYERPEEPFHRLRRMGAFISVPGKNTFGLRAQSPIVRYQNEVLCCIICKVDFDKSVKVGDHTIVVAEVTKVARTGNEKERVADPNADGLTYAKRGYRGVGDQIDPASLPEMAIQIEQASVAADKPGEKGSPDEKRMTTQGAADPRTEASDPSVETQPPTSEVAKTSAAKRTDIDYFESIAEDDEENEPGPRSNKIVEEEEEYDFGFESVEDEPQQRSQRPLVEDSAAAQEEAQSKPQDRASAVQRTQPAEKDQKPMSGSQRWLALHANGP